jgi:hypothetical protein
MKHTEIDLNPAQGRHDIYLLAHKGLRAFMAEVLTTVGRIDADDASEVTRALAQVRDLLELCRAHLEKEEQYVHVAMEARRRGSTVRTADDHAAHVRAFEQLELDVRTVEENAAVARAAAITRLYRNLAVFIAENFVHMQIEETENNAVLWATHSDAELMALQQAIVASLSPEQQAAFLRWMAPYLTPVERATLLGGLKRNAPVQVFGNILAMLKPYLDVRDWSKLMAALSH